MKIKKKIILLSLCPVFFVPFLTIISCGNSGPSKTEYYNYIANRSFSLQLEGDVCAPNQENFIVVATDRFISAGTAWIIDNVKGGNQYEYYLGTNFHVASIFIPGPGTIPVGTVQGTYESVYSLPIGDETAYITNLRAKVWNSESLEYTTIPRNSIDTLHEITLESCWNSNFSLYQDNEHQPPLATGFFTDFSVLTVDFGNFNTSMQDIFIQSKLDALNTEYVEKNIPITKFKLNPYTKYTSDFYTFGYPQTSVGSDIENSYSYGKPKENLCVSPTTNTNLLVKINNYTGDKIFGMGSFYRMSNIFKSWHGQSGSMVIDDKFNLVCIIDLGSSPRETSTSFPVMLCNNIQYNDELNFEYNFISDFLTTIGITGNNQDKYFV